MNPHPRPTACPSGTPTRIRALVPMLLLALPAALATAPDPSPAAPSAHREPSTPFAFAGTLPPSSPIAVPRPGPQLADEDRPTNLIAVPSNTRGRAPGQPAVSSLPRSPLVGPRPRTPSAGIVARSDMVRRFGDDRISFTIIRFPHGPFGTPWLNPPEPSFPPHLWPTPVPAPAPLYAPKLTPQPTLTLTPTLTPSLTPPGNR
jgi:hypothetical protein